MKVLAGECFTELHASSVAIWNFLINTYLPLPSTAVHTYMYSSPNHLFQLSKRKHRSVGKSSAIIPVQLPLFSRRRVANTQMRHTHLLVQPNIIMLRNEETKTSKKKKTSQGSSYLHHTTRTCGEGSRINLPRQKDLQRR